MTNTSNKNENFKSGFIAIAGAPNVGKSTLLNAMIGDKVSIISPKPQTTRNRIAGILNGAHSQIIFLDTPGIHTTAKIFNRKMVETAFSVIEDGDLVLVVIDAAKPDPESETLIVEKLTQSRNRPAVLAINKIDLVRKPKLLLIIDRWAKAYPFNETVPVSAKEGIQIPELITSMEKLLPSGPQYFPDDIVTDLPERFLAAEMIREKIFLMTGQEIPFSTAVTIDSFKEDPEKQLVTIHATIHLEKDSQKGIIIGKRGSMLRSIGEAARHDIEEMVESKVFLKLFVRVDKNWSNDPKALQQMGY